MSKASEYANQFEVKQPKFFVQIDGRPESLIACIDSEGRIMQFSVHLSPEDAIRYRDWITENFDE